MAKKKLLLAAVIVGALAAALLLLYAKQESEKHAAEIGEKVSVVTAGRDIPAGTPLDKNLVSYSNVPRKFLPANPIYEQEMDLYLGAQLTVPVAAGKMILASDFARTEITRDLASKVPKDERALSIPVDAISGVSGLLKPGDRVDLLGTFPVSSKDELIPDAASGQASVGYVTMTLLQNVTLLAVGQQLSEINAQANNRAGYSTVTLSVTIQEAELLTIAQTRGKLTLLLRNSDDVDTKPVSKTTLKEVLENLAIIQKTREENVKKQIVKRPVIKPQEPSIEIDSGSRKGK